ncbi:MAG: 16S rRNA (cytosine(1402)-N(4))-methyltransferase RsmH [Lachnospiraceae bacterium]|nr:16S rRNA (cytosine(1402)-N(4))-methyltransferase RsmH [Lachnospiraceae bacterium]
MEYSHSSVLLKEVIEGLNIKPSGIYMDGTTGGGGHSLAIAERLTEGGKLYCFDQDEDAIAAAGERLKDYSGRTELIRANFSEAEELLKERGVKGLDGVLLDLGVSSYQLDNAERGFSYRYDAPLDMRMDRRQTLSASVIVNEWSEDEIFRIIRDYGEEKFAKNIAKHIVRARSEKKIESTFELNDIIRAAIPARMRADGHPSKRSFQALRIACNRELEVLREVIEALPAFLNPGGRMAVISFHSLEDRIVKTAFKTAQNPCTCPPGLPVCACGRKPLGRCIGSKPVTAGEEELLENHRAASAKLRIFERAEEI